MMTSESRTTPVSSGGDAPGAYRPGQLSVGVEIIGVPPIDGSTGVRGTPGFKRQITASDKSAAFPRPRLALGLPAPEGFRAFAGLAYIPPVEFKSVSVHYLAGEGGIAWVPGPLRVGIRAHALYAKSESPVTDPVIRDTLHVGEYGADLSGAYEQLFGPLAVTPYAGVGLSHLVGNFRVTSDAVLLTSNRTALTLNGGVRLVLSKRWQGIAEADFYPGRMIHPAFRLGYLFDLFQ